MATSPAQLTLCVFVVALVHLSVTPHTKVEESFALQAVHDFLFLARPLDRELHKDVVGSFQSNFKGQLSSRGNDTIAWDHEKFPGVVHRTFLNSLVVATLSYPFKVFLSLSKVRLQFVARAVVAALFSLSYFCLMRSIARYLPTGVRVSRWVTLLSITQYHYLFYASRTLPNTFALIVAQFAFACWIARRWRLLLALVAFCVLVERFETFILFGLILGCEVAACQLKLTRILVWGIPSGLMALILSVPFDSYLWQRWVWPEGDGLLFNVVANRSHEYGTQPWAWYFYSVLPRLLLNSTPFLVYASPYAYRYLGIGLNYLAIYSLLPHKELRFVIYVVPLLNLAAASALIRMDDWIDDDDTGHLFTDTGDKATKKDNEAKKPKEKESSKSSELRKRAVGKKINSKAEKNETSNEDKPPSLSLVWAKIAVRLGVFAHLALNVCITLFSLYLAFYNYPGGRAVELVNGLIAQQSTTTPSKTAVYVSNLAAQTGFTLFLQLDEVYYNKEPNFEPSQFKDYRELYLILELADHRRYLGVCNEREECPLTFVADRRSMVCKKFQTIITFERIGWNLVRMKPILNLFYCR